jgi:predicted RecB family endonuclease
MHYTHPPVQKAYALLQQISADESARQLADEEGIEEGKIMVARALLDVLDDETIALKTELPIETLKKLRSNSGLMVNV